MTTYTYIGGVNGNWNDAASWSPAGVPGAGDNALIGAGENAIVFGRDDAVDDLTIASGATFRISPGSQLFTVNGAFDNAGTAIMGSGEAMVFAAPLTTAEFGDFSVPAKANIDFQGTLDNVGATLNFTSDEWLLGTIDGGTISGTLTVGRWTSPSNTPDTTLTLEGNPTFTGADGVGPGTIVITDASDVDFTALVVSGAETIANATIMMESQFYDSVYGTGTGDGITIGAGDELTLAANTTLEQVASSYNFVGGGGDFINNGTITQDNTGEFLTIDTSQFTNAGTMDIYGDLEIGNLDKFGDRTSTDFSNTGTINLYGGTLYLADPSTVLDLGNINNVGGSILMNDDVFHFGSFDGGTVVGTIVIAQNGELTISDNPVFEGAGGVGPATIDITEPYGEVDLDGAASALSLANVVINIGAGFDQLEGDLGAPAIDATGQVTFAASTTINAVNGASAIQGGVLVNDGVISVASPSVMSIDASSFQNVGAIDIAAGGELDINQSGVGGFVNTGTVSVASTGFLWLGTALTTAQLGTVNAAAGARVFFAGGLANSGAVFNAEAGVYYQGEIDGGAIDGALTALYLTLADDPTLAGAGGVGAATIVLATSYFNSLDFSYGGTLANVDFEQTPASGFAGYERVDFADAMIFAADVTWSLQDAETAFNGAGSLVNDGTIALGDDAGLEISSPSFTNAGEISVAAGDALIVPESPLYTPELQTFTDSGDLSGGGTLVIRGGTTIFAAGATVELALITISNFGADGTFDDTLVEFDESLSYAGGLIQRAETTVDIAADDTLTLGGTTFISGLVQGPGTLELSNGTTTFQYGASVQVAAWDNLGATVELGQFLAYAGAFTAQASTLTLAGGDLNLTGAVDLLDTTVNGTEALYTGGATSVSLLTLGAAWVNAGTVTQGEGVTLAGAALLYNAAGAVYDLVGSSGVALDAGSTALVNNAGTFELTQGAGASVIAANMYNSGTIAAETGTLDFQGALWGPGQADVGAGATLELDGVGGAAVQLVFAAATGTIALDDFNASGGTRFFGTISGFGADDTIALGAPYDAATHALFAENAAGTGGVLTLVDGALTGHIALSGVYATSDFAVKAGASGGAVVTFA